MIIIIFFLCYKQLFIQMLSSKKCLLIRSSSIWEGCRSICEPVSGAVLDDRMTLYLRMGKSHRQGSVAGSDKNENK